MEHSRQPAARAQRGFSLMEVLGALVLLAVIAAIAVPNVIGLSANMKSMQLDEKARQVYNAAQLRLASLQSAGEGEAVTAAVKADNIGSGKPSDYTGTWGSGAAVYAISNLQDSGPVSEYFIGEQAGTGLTAALAETDRFIIELSPQTAEVYSVFYWPQDAALPNDAREAYEAVKGVRGAEERKELGFGYYGGEGQLSSTGEASTPEPTGYEFGDFDYTIVNDEELYLSIPKKDLKGGNALFDPQKLSVEIGMRAEGSEDETTATASGEKLGVDYETGKIDVILDSMRPGLGFEDVVAGIPAGSNFEVTHVKAIYDGTEHLNGNTHAANSLFAAADYENGTVSVASVRHLRNLRLDTNKGALAYSSVKIDADAVAKKAGPAENGTISFDGSTWEETSVSSQSATWGQQDHGGNLNPLDVLEPIAGSGPFAGEGSAASSAIFDGAGVTLSAFCIGEGSSALGSERKTAGTTDDVGLFAQAGFTLKDVHLDTVRVCGAENVGALAGRALSSARIEGCRVTGASFVAGSGKVGGLVGSAATDRAIENCSIGYAPDGAAEQATHVWSSGPAAGGLVGSFSGSKVRSCKVLADVECGGEGGSSYAGGLAGQVTGGKACILNCRVGAASTSTTISASGRYTGGVAGSFAGSEINGCDMFATVRGGADGNRRSTTGGIVGLANATAAQRDAETGEPGQVRLRTEDANAYAFLADCRAGADNATVSIRGAGSQVGGLVGCLGEDCAGALYNARAYARVGSTHADSEGNSLTGGLVGIASCDAVVLQHCRIGNSESRDGLTIEGTGDYVGGAIGYLRATCTITGGSPDSPNASTVLVKKVAGKSYVGGLVGYCKDEAVDGNGVKVGSASGKIALEGTDKVGDFFGSGSWKSSTGNDAYVAIG